ncbi:efflux transporter outer membrane subunit [Pelagicoccus mobilis]|uniref:TolC family protein n=1 Tax=Pelagicoccus mobilis TaxID=415221 RepID=A0A934RYZ3_9BACT|nr:TolC family protein [Pelagicoccus mobilis]MBK1878100.1 TolC family protein [Pelagicoccus mobilis]
MPLRPDFSQQSKLKRQTAKSGLLGVVVFGLAGCVSTPPSKLGELDAEVPTEWSSRSEQQVAFEASSWMKDFEDPKLESILAEAMEYNYDLKRAGARLDAALAGTRFNRSELYPSVILSGNGSESRRSSASGINQTPTNKSYGLNARMTWEIDLWGKVRNGYKGDLADGEAAVADYEAARLSIAAQVAKAWYSAIEANQQYELEVRTLEALTESSRIIEENFANGIARALDVRLIRANVASSRSALENRRRNRDASIRSLEVLLGRYPKKEIDVVSEFPDLKASIPVGLPSELLLRRPDIVAAERRLAAAEQRKFEKSKARLPNVNLSLSRGTSAKDFQDIFELMDNRIWSKSLSVAQTVFRGGRLKADYQRAIATYEQNVANYSDTVLTAFREVENALSNQDSFAVDYEALKVAASESIEAEKLAWEEYSSGLTGITTVLDSVRRAINSQRAFILVANRRIQSRIDLYLALGGGFETES